MGDFGLAIFIAAREVPIFGQKRGGGEWLGIQHITVTNICYFNVAFNVS